jgi:hypothetical protein
VVPGARAADALRDHQAHARGFSKALVPLSQAQWSAANLVASAKYKNAREVVREGYVCSNSEGLETAVELNCYSFQKNFLEASCGCLPLN